MSQATWQKEHKQKTDPECSKHLNNNLQEIWENCSVLLLVLKLCQWKHLPCLGEEWKVNKKSWQIKKSLYQRAEKGKKQGLRKKNHGHQNKAKVILNLPGMQRALHQGMDMLFSKITIS